MREDLDRLERLVDNILEAGRFERSGYKLHRQPTDLGRLVERRLGALERTPKHKPLHVTLDLAAGVIVNVDCSALERAIDAVLENSLKYNDKAAVDLAVSLARREGAVHLVFADNGIGLERGDLNAIFERFYRVDSARTRAIASRSCAVSPLSLLASLRIRFLVPAARRVAGHRSTSAST